MYNGPQRKNQRLKNYDYSRDGFYFVTICTKNREDFFGEIIEGKMFLNEYGKIAENEILKTEEIRKEIKIDIFVIMPNHLHLLIVIENNLFDTVFYTVGNTGLCSLLPRNEIRPQNGNITKNKLSNTLNIRNKYNDFIFGWQKSFFDVIIQNDEQLEKTRQYIINNPLKWELDVNNKKNEDLVKKIKKDKLINQNI